MGQAMCTQEAESHQPKREEKDKFQRALEKLDESPFSFSVLSGIGLAVSSGELGCMVPDYGDRYHILNLVKSYEEQDYEEHETFPFFVGLLGQEDNPDVELHSAKIVQGKVHPTWDSRWKLGCLHGYDLIDASHAGRCEAKDGLEVGPVQSVHSTEHRGMFALFLTCHEPLEQNYETASGVALDLVFRVSGKFVRANQVLRVGVMSRATFVERQTDRKRKDSIRPSCREMFMYPCNQDVDHRAISVGHSPNGVKFFFESREKEECDCND